MQLLRDGSTSEKEAAASVLSEVGKGTGKVVEPLRTASRSSDDLRVRLPRSDRWGSFVPRRRPLSKTSFDSLMKRTRDFVKKQRRRSRRSIQKRRQKRAFYEVSRRLRMVDHAHRSAARRAPM